MVTQITNDRNKRRAQSIFMAPLPGFLTAATVLLVATSAQAQSIGCPAGATPNSVDNVRPISLDWLDEKIYELRGGNLGIRNFTTTRDAAIAPDSSAVYIAEVVSACQPTELCPCTQPELDEIYQRASCPYWDFAGNECGFPGITEDECFAKGCCYDDTSPLYWCYEPPTREELVGFGDPLTPDCEALPDRYTVTCHIIFATLNASETATVLAGGECSTPFNYFREIEVISGTKVGEPHQVLVLDDDALWRVEAAGMGARAWPVKLFTCGEGAFSFAVNGDEAVVSCGEGLYIVNVESGQDYKLSISRPSWISSWAFPSLSLSAQLNSFVFDLPPREGGEEFPPIQLGVLTLILQSGGVWTQTSLDPIAVDPGTELSNGTGTCQAGPTPLASANAAARTVGVMAEDAQSGSRGLAMVQLGEDCELDGLRVQTGGENEFRSGALAVVDLDDRTRSPWPFYGVDGNLYTWGDGLVGKVTAGQRMMVAVCGGGARAGDGEELHGVGCYNLDSHVVVWDLCRLRPDIEIPEDLVMTTPAPPEPDTGLSTAAQIAIIVACSIAYLCLCWWGGLWMYLRLSPKKKAVWRPNAVQSLLLKLFAFYKVHNRGQLDNCLAVSQYHIDKQDELNQKLRAKYGVDLHSFQRTSSRAELAMGPPRSPVAAAPPRQPTTTPGPYGAGHNNQPTAASIPPSIPPSIPERSVVWPEPSVRWNQPEPSVRWDRPEGSVISIAPPMSIAPSGGFRVPSVAPSLPPSLFGPSPTGPQHSQPISPQPFFSIPGSQPPSIPPNFGTPGSFPMASAGPFPTSMPPVAGSPFGAAPGMFPGAYPGR